MNETMKHYEENILIQANPVDVFNYADDHRNFSSHMNQSSWMMGGSSMKTEPDDGKGQKVGSHIRMNGKVFGVNLYLDEVITEYDPPNHKAWATVGDVNLLVIDQYKLGFKIIPNGDTSDFRVYIDYGLPKSWKTKLLGQLLSGIYAKWCVKQMVGGVKNQFSSQ